MAMAQGHTHTHIYTLTTIEWSCTTTQLIDMCVCVRVVINGKKNISI